MSKSKVARRERELKILVEKLPPDVTICSIFVFLEFSGNMVNHIRDELDYFGYWKRDPSRHVWFLFVNVIVKRTLHANRRTFDFPIGPPILINRALVQRVVFQLHDKDKKYAFVSSVENCRFRCLQHVDFSKLNSSCAFAMIGQNRFDVLTSLMVPCGKFFPGESDLDGTTNVLKSSLSKLKKLSIVPKDECRTTNFFSQRTCPSHHLESLELLVDLDITSIHDEVKFPLVNHFDLAGCWNQNSINKLFCRIDPQNLTYVRVFKNTRVRDRTSVPRSDLPIPSRFCDLRLDNLKELVLSQVDLSNMNISCPNVEKVTLRMVEWPKFFISQRGKLNRLKELYIPAVRSWRSYQWKTDEFPSLQSIKLLEFYNFDFFDMKLMSLKQIHLRFFTTASDPEEYFSGIEGKNVDGFANSLERLVVDNMESAKFFEDREKLESLKFLSISKSPVLTGDGWCQFPNLRRLYVARSFWGSDEDERINLIDELMKSQVFPMIEQVIFDWSVLPETSRCVLPSGVGWKILPQVELLASRLLCDVLLKLKERQEANEEKIGKMKKGQRWYRQLQNFQNRRVDVDLCDELRIEILKHIRILRNKLLKKMGILHHSTVLKWNGREKGWVMSCLKSQPGWLSIKCLWNEIVKRISKNLIPWFSIGVRVECTETTN